MFDVHVYKGKKNRDPGQHGGYSWLVLRFASAIINTYYSIIILAAVAKNNKYSLQSKPDDLPDEKGYVYCIEKSYSLILLSFACFRYNNIINVIIIIYQEINKLL